jgi:hypothetical protein
MCLKIVVEHLGDREVSRRINQEGMSVAPSAPLSHQTWNKLAGRVGLLS